MVALAPAPARLTAHRASLARDSRRRLLPGRPARALVCRAGSLGFEDHQTPREGDRQDTLGKPAYGLSSTQIELLRQQSVQDELAEAKLAERITAKANYTAAMRSPTVMIGGGAGSGAPGAPSQAPPDLPSLLLNSRIAFIGMPLVPAVTELMIAQLLWLQYDSPEKPVYVYINSEGSQTQDGRSVGFETEAYAIADTMGYVKPEVQTICVGKAWGQAAMLLGRGAKGKRFVLPNSSVKLTPPRMNQAGGLAVDIGIKAAEVDANSGVYFKMIAESCGKSLEQVEKDLSRPLYLTPDNAVEYGLVDMVLKDSAVRMEKKDYEQLLAQAQQAASQGMIMNK